MSSKKKPPLTKKKEKEGANDAASVEEEPPTYYKVISVSQPKKLHNSPSKASSPPHYRRYNATTTVGSTASFTPRIDAGSTTQESREISARDRKRDASVETRISRSSGQQNGMPTDTTVTKEILCTTNNDEGEDETSPDKTYSERLDSLGIELSEIRLLLERVRRFGCGEQSVEV